MQHALMHTTTNPNPKNVMKVLKAIVRVLVAGAFAAAEAVLFIDELPIARLWHRRQHP